MLFPEKHVREMGGGSVAKIWLTERAGRRDLDEEAASSSMTTRSMRRASSRLWVAISAATPSLRNRPMSS